jgi:pimeloyl-ACP methyl ester carboxylesterase
MLLGEHISIEMYADGIHALLLQEGIKKCLLIGHSMGGYITLAFARKYPEQLTGIGLVHSTAFADSEEKKKNRLKGIAFIEEYGSHAFLKASTPNLFSQHYRENFPERIEALVDASGGVSKKALQQYYQAMMQRPDSTDVLRGNPLPILFVAGTEDIAAPIDDVLQQVHLPNKSYIHVLEGTGHMSMLEDPEALNRFLLGFINR